MVIGVGRVVLRLHDSHSLKDKRRVLKPVIAQVQRQFQLAVAEVDSQDEWQIGVLGLACVSNSAAHADQIIAKAVGFIERQHIDAEMLEYQTEIIHAL